MNRRIPLLLLVLSFVHGAFAQAAKRQAPPPTQFALEYLSRSEGFPTHRRFRL